MKITVLGTGMVGQTLADKLDSLGHDVAVGTRDPEATIARKNQDGVAEYAQWLQEHPRVTLLPLPQAGSYGDLVLNATHGETALAALEAVGADNLAGKVLLDLALPIDLSEGLPPRLTVVNTDSLGEQVQRAFPQTKVVKSLTSVFCKVMVEPTRVPGEHSIFVAGNDPEAKRTVSGILNEFGWSEDSIIDLGDISSARALEMYSRMYFTLVNTLGTFELNIKVIRGTN